MRRPTARLLNENTVGVSSLIGNSFLQLNNVLPVKNVKLAALILALGALLIILGWPPDIARGQLHSDESQTCSPTPQVFRMAYGRPLTLDPALTRSSSSGFYIDLLYSGLVTGGPIGEVLGDLAESWTISEDLRTYTFTLRENSAFADGSPITAQDVVFSISRALAPATASPVAETYLGDILGAREFRAGLRPDLPGLRTPDPRTVQIELTVPKAAFLHKLTYPTSFVVDPRQVAEPDWWVSPNSSGPFVLAQFIANGPIVLIANPNHHAGSESNLIRAEFHPVGGADAFNAYRRGNLDMIFVGGEPLQQVRYPTHELNSHLRDTDATLLSYLGFRSATAPFDDPLVRQAFAMAIDTKRLNVLINHGTAKPADGVIPPGIPGYLAGSAGTYPYDPERARELLAQSSYGSAEELPEIIFTSIGRSLWVGGIDRAIAYTLSQNLGVEVRFRAATLREVLDLLDGPSDPRMQMFTLGWYADYLDPENFVSALFESSSVVNHFEYASAFVDDLIAEAEDRGLGQDRLALLRAAERQIVAEAPLLPLFFRGDHFLIQPWVEDLIYQGRFNWLSQLSIPNTGCPA